MATRVWIGAAVPVAQVSRISVGGTWLIGDTITLRIGSASLVLTVGSDTSTSDIAEIVSRTINATSATDNLKGTESRTRGGQEIPEFQEIGATYNASLVTITAATAGIPFTLTYNLVSSGTFAMDIPTAATGPNHFNEGQNWNPTAAPANGDKLVFQNSNIDCLYEISQPTLSGMNLQADRSYSGRIGLSIKNPRGYIEYRKRFLMLNYVAAERSVVVGDGNGSGSPRINLDVDVSEPVIAILSTGTPELSGIGAVEIIGGGPNMEVGISGGMVSFASDDSTSTTIETLGISSNQSASPSVLVYPRTTINTVNKSGGTILFINSPTSMNIVSFKNGGGIVEFNGQGGCTKAIITGGLFRWNSTGVFTQIHLGGNGHLDFSMDSRNKLVTNAIFRTSDASKISDPLKVVANLRIDNVQISDTSNLILGSDVRLTRANL